jgi:DNA-binding transcriptional ArsR family regulator
MTPNEESLYDALERVFHEPSRLAIMSALCAAREGLSFPELRDTCRLTDGNLNRHLKVLDEASVIRIRKEFVDAKPRTTVELSERGMKRFTEYLGALNEVLERARQSIPAERPAQGPIALRARARA